MATNISKIRHQHIFLIDLIFSVAFVSFFERFDYVVFNKHGKIINIVRDQYFTLNHRNADDPNYLIKTGYTMRDLINLRS